MFYSQRENEISNAILFYKIVPSKCRRYYIFISFPSTSLSFFLLQSLVDLMPTTSNNLTMTNDHIEFNSQVKPSQACRDLRFGKSR